MEEDQGAPGEQPEPAPVAGEQPEPEPVAGEQPVGAPAAEELPWLRPAFREGLAGLRHSIQVQARQFALDMHLLAELARQVPRSRWDERGSSAWISFQREVALARSCSDRAALAEIRAALRLTGPALPTTMALLQAGRITVQRARVLIGELEHYDDQLTTLIDAELAERAAALPPWRIRQEVRRAAACLDPDAAAARVAAKNTDRAVEFSADDDDQASVLISGPAVPLTRWYTTIDSHARALKQAGDPRTLAQLRFDLATSTYPCTSHRPADSTSPPTIPAPAAQAQPAQAQPAQAQPAQAQPARQDVAGQDAADGPAGAAGDPAADDVAADVADDLSDDLADDTAGHDVAADVGADAAGHDAAADAAGHDAVVPAAHCPALPLPAPRPADALPADPRPAAAALPAPVLPAPVLPVAVLPVPSAVGGLLAGAGVEPAGTDCRLGRPVQAHIVMPVETALGLSNEPAWLDGYGWISAPTGRLLLIDAELRRVCAQTGTGQLVDLSVRDVRPAPTPAGLRAALLDMVHAQVTISDVGWRTEDQHDPSQALRQFVQLRDRFCDGPTGAQVGATAAELDHDIAYPTGPTAAWNLVARGSRTHQLKHHGWTPIRTPTATSWVSPAGQIIQTEHAHRPPPGIDSAPTGAGAAGRATLPDPDQLAATDLHQLQPDQPDDLPPAWLRIAAATPDPQVQWIEGSADPPPF